MQLKLSVLLASLVVLCFAGTKAMAQEAPPPEPSVEELNYHPDLNLNQDKTLLMESDAKPSTKSQHENPAVKKSEATTKPAEKNERDPLSFNFIYFIIEKFKISDIVDD